MRARRLLFLLGLGLVLMPVTQAAIYKWVDERGNVHYGERPGDAQAEEIKIKSQSVESKSGTLRDRLKRQKHLLQSYDLLRQAKEKKRQEEAVAKAENKRKCITARDQLRKYQEAPYLYDLDDAGNRITKSEAERRKAIDQLRAEIRGNCK